MGDVTKIQWADKTFNPWIGCTKIAPECDNCYAAAQDNFRKWTPDGWGAGKPRRMTKTWGDPVKWNREAEQNGVRYRVFCASLADVFDGEVENEWRERLWQLIFATPNLDYLILTKRPANIIRAFEFEPGVRPLREIPDNIWFGTSVGCKERIPQIAPLLKVPAAIHFLSIEPLLEDLGELDLSGIDWVIVGGESGSGARPCNWQWIRAIVAQCKAAGVPVFVKQLGANVRSRLDAPVRLRDHKGGDMAEWPVDLRIREFPKKGE